MTGDVTLGGFRRLAFPQFSSIFNLVASTTGTQAGATPISASIVRFATVASAGNSGLLPPAKGGRVITVVNAGANSMNVFPNNVDTIDSFGTSAAYPVPAGMCITFRSTGEGQWFSDVPNGYLVGSVNGAVTAAGSTQGAATPVTGNLVNVSTGTANQGILLPVGVPGMTIVVNNATGNTIKIYPNGTGQIDAGGASTAQTLTSAHRGCTLYCFAANLWVSSLFGAVTS